MKIKKRFVSNKKGQEVLGLSFGVIFSILLIIFFILIAFIVIKEFLYTQGCAEIGIFVDNIAADVKRVWNSQTDSHSFIGVLPTGLEYVCFADLSNNFKGDEKYEKVWDELRFYEGKEANTFFYPVKKTCEMPYHNIPHLDVEKIIKNENPYCIEANGKVEIKVEKKFNDKLVSLKRV